MSLDVQASFLTGSYAYGTPTPESDIDVVLFMPDEGDRVILMEESNPGSTGSPNAQGGLSLRFGRLNLIVCNTPEQLEQWRSGTEALIARRPVTRAEAVAYLDERWGRTPP